MDYNPFLPPGLAAKDSVLNRSFQGCKEQLGNHLLHIFDTVPPSILFVLKHTRVIITKASYATIKFGPVPYD